MYLKCERTNSWSFIFQQVELLHVLDKHERLTGRHVAQRQVQL